MIVDLVVEFEPATLAAVRIIEDLLRSSNETRVVALSLSDPLGGRACLGGAAADALPSGEWWNYFDFPRFSDISHDFENDYWFDQVEMDESGSVWVEVTMPDATTRRIDIEADNDLGDTLLDFLEGIVHSDEVQAVLSGAAAVSILLNVGDGGHQRKLGE